MTAANNFIFLKPITINSTILWLMVVVWGGIVITGLWSVFSRAPMATLPRLFWAFAMVALPIGGMFAYCFYCLLTSDWEIIKRIGFFSPAQKRTAQALQRESP